MNPDTRKEFGPGLCTAMKPQLSSISSTFPRQDDPASFSAEAESLRLGNLLACLFWLGLSAEAWMWSWAVLAWSFSSVWWRKDEKPTKLQGPRFLFFVFFCWRPRMENSLFWNFFSHFQMWLKQNQLPVCVGFRSGAKAMYQTCAYFSDHCFVLSSSVLHLYTV